MKTRTNHGNIVELESAPFNRRPSKKHLLFAPTMRQAEAYATAAGWRVRQWVWFGPHGHRGLMGISNPHLKVLADSKLPDEYWNIVEAAAGRITWLDPL